MDVNTITQLISGVGFPIVACIAIWYSYNRVLERVMDAIEANTKALIELSEKLEKEEAE